MLVTPERITVRLVSCVLFRNRPKQTCLGVSWTTFYTRATFWSRIRFAIYKQNMNLESNLSRFVMNPELKVETFYLDTYESEFPCSVNALRIRIPECDESRNINESRNFCSIVNVFLMCKLQVVS